MATITRSDLLKTAFGTGMLGALAMPAFCLADTGTAADPAVANELAIKFAIRDQITNYCISMDRLDVELGYNVFTEGCQVDYGADIYQGDAKGFVDKTCLEWHPGLQRTAHRMTNILVKVDDEKTARSMTYGLILLLSKPDDAGNGRLMLNAVRYLDTWVLEDDGTWRINGRTLCTEWNASVAVDSVSSPVYSERDTTDPFYDLFPEYK